MGSRRAAAHPAARGVAADRTRRRTACDAAQQDPARRLWQPIPAAAGPAASRARLRPCGFPAPGARRSGAGRHDASSLCSGSRALAGRAVVGSGRSHAGAFGRRVCAREPPDHLARVPGLVPRPQGAAPGELLRRSARQPRPLGAARRRAAAHCASHAGPLQRNLFRTRLPCPLPRLPAGGRPRPHRKKWLRLAENPVGAAARARDPAQAR